MNLNVKHELPAAKMFAGYDIGLLVQGQIAEVVAHEISQPARTWVSEDGGEFKEFPGSMRGSIYGRGPVRLFQREAVITFEGEDHSYVPHGKLEELSGKPLPPISRRHKCSPSTTPSDHALALTNDGMELSQLGLD